jgi:hypothetical protein
MKFSAEKPRLRKAAKRCYDIQATNLVSRLLVAGYPDGVSGK